MMSTVSARCPSSQSWPAAPCHGQCQRYQHSSSSFSNLFLTTRPKYLTTSLTISRSKSCLYSVYPGQTIIWDWVSLRPTNCLSVSVLAGVHPTHVQRLFTNSSLLGKLGQWGSCPFSILTSFCPVKCSWSLDKAVLGICHWHVPDNLFSFKVSSSY